MTYTAEYEHLLMFWYGEPMCQHWFSATAEIDQMIRERFEGMWQQAAQDKLDYWQGTAEGSLALAIVLDQLPLNMYRGQALSFSTEAKAIAVAKQAIGRGFHRELDSHKAVFLVMPLMHSENINDQQLSVDTFEQLQLAENLRFARHHRDLVARFGRFPHRNQILGRESTSEELDYLASDQAFTG